MPYIRGTRLSLLSGGKLFPDPPSGYSYVYTQRQTGLEVVTITLNGKTVPLVVRNR